MKRLFLIIGVLVLLGGGAALVFAKMRATGSVDQTQYKVTAAQDGSVKKTVSATGTLQPWATVDIKSKAGGRVNALLVDVGSVVKKSQILARIDPADTLLSVSTAQANIAGALAHTQQSQQTYQLQLQQGRIAIANARAALGAAEAARAASAAQVASAQGQAAAQPSQTSAAIAQAQANYDAAVKDRQALDATNPQDRASAQAAYDQAVANQKNAKASLARQATLVRQGYVAQQDVDTAQAAYDVVAATVQSALEKLRTIRAQQQANAQAADAKIAQAKAALDSAAAGRVDIVTKKAAARQAAAALQQTMAQVQVAQAALQQAQANLANNGIKRQDVLYNESVIKSNQANLTNAQTTLQQTVVRAPSDGVVLTKAVSQGTYITSGLSLNSTGSTILTLGDITRMYVQATVDETDLASVDENQSVEVNFDAYPGIPFEGKVTRVEPQAVVNQNVTQFNVRVEIDNSSPTFRLLKPGMNATCNFLVGSKENVLTVPNSAVQTDDQGPYVSIAAGGKPAPADPASGAPADPDTLVGVKTQRRAVETGLAGDEATEITSGLKSGERVVTQTIAPVVATPAAASSPFGGGARGGFGGGGGGGRGGR